GNLDGAGRPLQVQSRFVEHHTDVYENRMVRAFVDEVAVRLLALHRALDRAQQPALAAETITLLAELHRARLQAPFLDDVSVPTMVPTTVTMVLLKRPDYRAAFEGWLAL